MHATTPVDAIQRFVGRIELGVIPHVIDTVIFIKDGTVFKVLSLEMEVKVPSGMTEADLARPIVVVRDFETNKSEYELYSYGEETVLIPVKEIKAQEKGISKLAKEAIKEKMERYSRNVQVEISSPDRAIVYVDERDIPRIIGKQGAHIEEIEKELGIGLDIRERKNEEMSEELKYVLTEDGNSIFFELDKGLKNSDVNIYADNELILSAQVGKKATIKIHKKSSVGDKLLGALRKNQNIVVSKR